MTRFILTAAAFLAIAACNSPNDDYANRDVPGTPTTTTTTPARTNPPTVTTNTNPQVTATAPTVDVQNNGAAGTADARKVDEQAFHRQFAAAWCERQKTCDSKGFQGWRDMNDCVDRKSDQATFSGDWKEMTCGGYRSESVQSCIDAMSAAQCDDWNNKEWKNECAKVYGCNS